MTAKGPFLEKLILRVNESAANTFTEEEVSTPNSKSESLAMLIHKILLGSSPPETIDGFATIVESQLTQFSEDHMLTPEDPSLLFKTDEWIDAGSVSGALTDYSYISSETHTVLGGRIDFDPPILYSKDKMYIGVVGTGNVGAKNATAWVYYTLEKVSREHYIAALIQ